MIQIYVRNKPLFLLDGMASETEAYFHRPDTAFANELSPSAIDTMLNELEKDSVPAGIFQHKNVDELFEAFKSRLTLIQAAGGLIYTQSRKDVLLIFRRGKWDLPKGKLDEGEDLKTCALREVREETGIEKVTIVKPLQVTYHTYYEKGEHILKESRWYLMETAEALPLTPQIEEDIEKCEWVPLKDIQTFTNNMHASIVDVINEGEKILSHQH